MIKFLQFPASSVVCKIGLCSFLNRFNKLWIMYEQSNKIWDVMLTILYHTERHVDMYDMEVQSTV